MGVIEDMLNALDRIPMWKELQNTPKRLNELERQVAELEGKLGGKWPADVCKFCGERAVRMTWSGVIEKGHTSEEWTCGQCKEVETRTIAPARR